MKKLLVLLLLVSSLKSLADEGMWLPQLLQALNEKQMKKMGMKITAADIYSINKSSLKDAIVSFGGFCTAELISNEGLLLTNHHCGFDAIQNHSSVTNNLIEKGFWAYNKSQEMQNQGLFVTFIERIEDVTKQALGNVTDQLSEKERQATIDSNLATLKRNYKLEPFEEILVKPFFDGNKYFLFVTRTFRDIRLVGAPPSSIGNFGKDTDNWMWPRHTGDFSMFRIYADKNNNPAAFSPDNVPYKPKRSLKISLDGVQPGDFTMVFGFPGKTTQYLPAAAVKQIMTVNDPAKIAIRGHALQIIDAAMRKDEHVQLQYSDKYRKIENAYKKWKGEVLGLSGTNAVKKKLDYESVFQERVNAKQPWKEKYGTVLVRLDSAYNAINNYGYARDYYTEIIPKIELLSFAADLNGLVKAYQKDSASYDKRMNDLVPKFKGLFDEYNVALDKQLFEKLIEMYVSNQDSRFVSPLVKNRLASNNSYSSFADSIYNSSSLTSFDKLQAILSKPAMQAVAGIKNDPAFALYLDMSQTYSSSVLPQLNELQAAINKLQRDYMAGQMEVFSERSFYPDANSTLRVTYGNVNAYQPRDAVRYEPFSYLDGIMEKYKPGDYEFDVPEKLIKLYNEKDYGPYGVNGRQPVCFIAANHTTGGNSGSPALDAYGNLVGLNFDRVWEGTMSDINYDPRICRNIMVDIRYVLFIVDKFAGAKNLIAEMNLVHPKSKKPAKK